MAALQSIIPGTDLPSITVPVGGIDEHTLTILTGLGWRAMYPLFGDLLVHPRDYRYHGPSGTHFVTASGVQSLVAHFRLEFEVIALGTPSPSSC